MMRSKTAAAPVVKASTGTYGMVAEFDGPEAIVAAAERSHEAGYRRMDAYTPIPIHGLDEALGFRPTRLPWLVFAAGLFGASLLFLYQTWVNVVDYPLNIAGRPYFSWISFIPATFEGMVLFASFAAVFGLFAICGFPQPYHPVANAPRFDRASSDLFFLCIEARDPNYDSTETRRFLESLKPRTVTEVEN